ncbi:Venom allergen 3 [Blattella germanica]|nr:Venom allergen 3 [Blattella germanica]
MEPTEHTGHYTQVVWADTKYVGCGFIAYKKTDDWYTKYYVCNYGPGGNIEGGTMYKTGAACSACSGSCETSTGLCL